MNSNLLKICLAACMAVSCAACNETKNILGDDVTTVCNDGKKDANESCDGADLGGKTCADFAGAGATGTLTCKDDCSFDSSACVAASACNNDGKIDASEACDGSDFGGKTCADFKGAGATGTLACANCVIDSSACVAAQPTGCESDDDCAAEADGKTKCDETDKVCVKPTTDPECTTDADCTGREDGKTKCDTTDKVCVAPATTPECTTDADCAGREDGKTKCDDTDKVCVAPATTPECTTDADCANREDGKTKCDDTDKVCVAPAVQVGCQTDADCEGRGDGNTKCDHNICVAPAADPVCGDGKVEGDEECDGSNLNGKTCKDVQPMSTGGTLECDPATCKFKAGTCTLPEEGTECDPDTFIESCDGTNIVYCEPETDDNGKRTGKYLVSTSIDCATGDSACIVIDSTVYGKYADCAISHETCSTAGKARGCMTDEYEEDYSTMVECAPASDGNYYTLDVAESEDELHYCGYYEYVDTPACLDSTGDCGKLTEDQGETCDATYLAHCDGNATVNCSRSIDYDTYQYVYSVDAKDCGKDSCVVITAELTGTDGNPTTVKQAMCMSSEDECATAGVESNSCLTSGKTEYLIDNLCASGDDGKNYSVMLDYEACSHGCDDTNKVCKKLADNEGEECDYELNEEAECKGNVAVNCDYWDEEVVAEECATGTTCNLTDNGAECLESCTNVGAATSECVAEASFFGTSYYTYTTTCTTLDKGNFLVETEEYCKNGCNDTNDGCKRISDMDGTACDTSVDTKKCDPDNEVVRLTCSSGKWSASNCEAAVITDSVCADMGTDNGGVQCLVPCTIPADPTEPVSVCIDDDYYGVVSLSGTCTADASGTKSFITDSKRTTCSGGCDSTTGKCIPLIENEGEACDKSTFEEHCEGNVGSYCASKVVTPYNCNKYEGATCAVAEVDGAPYVDCVTDDDKCDTIGEEVPVCFYASAYYSYVYGTKTCVKFDNNKTYYVQQLTGYCDECNEDGTCADE